MNHKVNKIQNRNAKLNFFEKLTKKIKVKGKSGYGRSQKAGGRWLLLG